LEVNCIGVLSTFCERCGHGEFINNICCGKKIAIDLKDDGGKYLNPDVEFHNISALKISELYNHNIDVVFVSNFLEHLPDRDALLKFFKEVSDVLKPNGKFIIVGPNLRYLPGKYWDYFDHYLGLTHLSLVEALELFGFEIEICIDKFLPHSDKGNKLPNPFFAWLYLKLPFFWRFYGKQFFIIAKNVK
jgi:SAM-dependent methyltransferase